MTGDRGTALDASVLVIGGGPAASVTAWQLASLGIDVIQAAGPEPAACDMIIGAAALSGLAEISPGLASLPRPVAAIDLSLGDGGARRLAGARAGVCDSGLLRAALRDHAAAAGARLISGTAGPAAGEAGRYTVRVQGTPAGGTEVTARHVVLAGGARPGPSPEAAGIGCARWFAGAEAADRVLLAVTVPAGPGRQEPPLTAWALPGEAGPDGAGRTTIGAARIGGDPLSPDEVLTRALRALAACDPALGRLVPAGPVSSGPLDTGFTPARAAAEPYLVAGEAAGLASPFTGEGLSAAIGSGRLAARAIARHAGDPAAARRAYARLLAAEFVGHFETARHATRRYHLTWRILADAAGSEHPFFAKTRRAVLAPDAPALRRSAAGLGQDGPDAVLAGPFLTACDEIALRTVRREWPVLAHILLGGGSVADQRVRPARLFLAGLLADGGKAAIRHAIPAAAVELATLGALAFLGSAGARGSGRGVDWASAAIVLVGDFLLAQASRLIAESAPELSWAFADWLGELTALRGPGLAGAGPAEAGDPGPAAVFGALLEFPARAGALLGGVPDGPARAVRDAGLSCGQAFVHAEDVLLLRGERSRLDTTLASAIRCRLSAIQPAAGEPAPGALAAAADACRAAGTRAAEAAGQVPGAAAARLLRQFTAAVTEPAGAPGRDRLARA
jgi:flavin-dependent dehydrogenase